MKYTLVYREDPQGYNWTVRNVHNQYAASQWADGGMHIRSWRTAAAAVDYMEIYRHRNHPHDLVWAPWPDDNPTALKPVTTAASYKPTHGGYPQPASPADLRVYDAIAKGGPSTGAVTGRFVSTFPAIEEVQRECPVSKNWWEAHTAYLNALPTIPPFDDGSNEEATTVPDSLVAELSKRHFVLIIRR